MKLKDFTFYGCDVETTSLDHTKGDIIEISFYRLNDDVQKTWYLRAVNVDNIETGALEVNSHLYEEITWQTKEGKLKYKDPKKALIEIDKFFMEDNSTSDTRFIIGHNITIFDIPYIKEMYKRYDMSDSYPFGIHFFDTMQLQKYEDMKAGFFNQDGYSLATTIKRHGVKNDKAHSALADTKATVETFLKMILGERWKEGFSALK